MERKQDIIMVNLQALTQAVTDETTVTSSAVALITNLIQQIKDAGVDQAALDDLTNKLTAQKDALAAAISQNTPAGNQNTNDPNNRNLNNPNRNNLGDPNNPDDRNFNNPNVPPDPTNPNQPEPESGNKFTR